MFNVVTEPAYVRTQPSEVFFMEFSGHTEITDMELQHCVIRDCGWPLSNECELLADSSHLLPTSSPVLPPSPESVYPPTIYADNQEIINGERGKTLNDCFWECLLGVPIKTVAEVGGGAVLSGSIPKAVIKKSSRVLGNKASRFTSVPSIVAHHFPGLDGQLTRMTGNLFTGKAPVVKFQKWPTKIYVKMLPTGTTLRFIGRWIPAIGWGLLAADLIILDQCIAKCRGEKSLLQTVWDEFFGIKPAY